MSDKITKSPQIRFAGYTDAWERRKLEDLADFSKGNGYSKSDLTDEGKPVILYGRLYTKYETVMESIDTYTIEKEKSVISKGNEVIVPASGETSEDISRAAVVSESGIILGGDLNIVRPRNEIDPVFLALTISNGKQQKELSKRAQGKSVVHLHNSDLKEVNLLFPRKEEQIKIGNFFKQFDKTIALHQSKYDKLVILKKSMLKKMFPKDGANVPEIRFAGFTDAWEQSKFSKVLKSHSFRAYLAEPSEAGNYEVIQQGDNPVVGYSDGEPFENFEGVTLFGDHTVSLYKPTEPFFVATDGVKILSGDGFDGMYLFSTLERYKPESQGYKRHFTILKNEDVWFTKNNDEQRKIGSFFANLDNLITLHQRELNSLKNLKKSLFQQMFI
jgi:type I restriction enzyme, S subunit